MKISDGFYTFKIEKYFILAKIELKGYIFTGCFLGRTANSGQKREFIKLYIYSQPYLFKAISC